MDHSSSSRQIICFHVDSAESRDQALGQLRQLAKMAEAGLIEGMAVRTVQGNGEVSYQSFGSVSADDWTRFVLHCVSAR